MALVVVGAGPASAAPELKVSPPSGPPGTEFTVTGTGFAATDVEIHWGSQDGLELTRTTGPDFSVKVAVPDGAPSNSHQVYAVTRNGNAVSTSSAPFQVTAGEVVTTTTSTTSTTVAEPVTSTTAGPVTRATTPPASDARQTSGVGGGAEDAADSVGGSGPGAAPTRATAGGGATSTTQPTVTTAGAAEAVPTTAAAGGSVNASALTPARGPSSEVALVEKPASQSSGVVANPGLLMAGLGMVFLGGAFLAVRNRQRPPG